MGEIGFSFLPYVDYGVLYQYGRRTWLEKGARAGRDQPNFSCLAASDLCPAHRQRDIRWWTLTVLLLLL
jgi:hypothetical protein